MKDKAKTPEAIFLCGFMGSGKSSLGKTLANSLKYDFFDLDQFIEKSEQRSIADIFQADGEPTFRDLEKKYLHELLQKKQSKVVALGGGTVCFFDNLKIIKEHGVLLYLHLPVKTISQRLQKAKQDRPLLKGLSEKELQLYVEQLLEERIFFYEQAHHTIDVLKTKPETLLNEIRKIQ